MPHIYVCSSSKPIDTNLSNPTTSIETLNQLGYDVTLSSHALDKWGNISSPIITRVSDLQEGFINPQYDVVMASVGGWCSNEILPHIDYKLIARYPKPFIGMSDITTLCWNLWQKANIPTIYGLNLRHFAEDTQLSEFGQFQKTLASSQEFSGFTRKPIQEFQVYRSGRMSGLLVGGNLAVMCWLLGTAFAPEIPNGAILFLEDDIETNGYYWQMYLTHLKQAGVFEKISGLVFGQVDKGTVFQPKSSFKEILDIVIESI
ncbi:MULTISPECIES: S66 peptidase family protein [unclassified Microcoleus]|uniref:S66 peptidase family protein n=1 Tax=unclassified Microcoleus TaxID=2642155 RepID=UPI001D39A6A7|nr:MULTISPECIES: LD-carboxypeptidase [unclassified Microcoleus]MCC3592886.1 LD-carboxypeptidase [Microcoleus sp. PH2017_28_MFU_U_A]MCC3644965.1 LD-carboxypeptidase [Microcoleus sp. PH2017_33_LGB_O_A]TAE52709.1 MAG: LD-carboxypeptidase [Oscillatoriales cyanobacterium]